MDKHPEQLHIDGELVDYTTWRKGRRTRGTLKIGVCPKCGRKGEIANGPNNTLHITHKGRLAGFFFVTDSCIVKQEQQ